MHRNHVANEHRFAKIHRLDRDRDGTRFRYLGREDSATDIHLTEQPAAKYRRFDWYRPASPACGSTNRRKAPFHHSMGR
jgi:hypothetical protein